MLDLCWLSLQKHKVKSFDSKKDALAYVQGSPDWSASDIISVYNRSRMFWVIGRTSMESIVLLTRKGTLTTVPFPPRTDSDKLY